MPYVIERFRWSTKCRRCGCPLAANEGDLHSPPGHDPYVTCALCTLYEYVGIDPPVDLRAVLAKFPRQGEDGEEYSPYPFQVIDADWATSARAVLLNEEMGCGKTIVTTLGGFRADWGNILFVPGSVKLNWAREIQKWRPELTPLVVERKRHWFLPDPGEVLISSYGLMPGDPCSPCRATKRRACTHTEGQTNPMPEVNRPFVLAADEVQCLQNKNARRRKWDLLKDRVWNAGGKLIGLTGTDVSNHPRDLWEILSLLNLERAAGWPDYEAFKRDFSDWYYVRKSERVGPTGYQRESILKKLRRVRIHRQRKHVLSHLPPLIERDLQVELNQRTIAELDQAVQRMLATRRAWEDVEKGLLDNPWGQRLITVGEKQVHRKLEPDEKERRDLRFADRVKMYFDTRPWTTDEELQLAVQEALDTKNQTPTFEELAKVRRVLTLAKIPEILIQVQRHEDANEPLLVFCQHVDVLEQVFKGRPGWALYTGRVSSKIRDETWVGFQKGEIRHGLGISITSGEVGLNLTRAGSMLFVDEHYNPARNQQAQARIQRPGAERHDVLQLYRLVANHKVDRLLRKTIDMKLSLANALKDDHASLANMRVA